MLRRPHSAARPASAGVALAALAVAGALITACTSSIGGTGTLAGAQGTASSPTSTGSSAATSGAAGSGTPTRPPSSSAAASSSAAKSSSAAPSSSPTPSDTATAALKSSLAGIGEGWMHAYAVGDEVQFCSLSDPPTLQRLFDQKGIGSCADMVINWDSDPALQARIASFSIPDPQKIVVSGSSAQVSSSNVLPTGLTSMSWIQESDQSWKVDVSILVSS
ncbi:MAG: hypothetical protein LBQ06_02395 [Frankiaceae bacterium]|jgi:hypothetical protein|nr:hypothetical protein [Frankiaceae bacterium]